MVPENDSLCVKQSEKCNRFIGVKPVTYVQALMIINSGIRIVSWGKCSDFSPCLQVM